MKSTILIQAASRSWSGGPDLCLAKASSGKSLLEHTVAKAKNLFSEVIIIAPEFDRGHFDHLGTCHYSHDADPLSRMVAAIAHLPNDAIVHRVNGISAVFECPSVRSDFPCSKFRDDFPPQFACEAYRVDALIEADKRISSKAVRLFPWVEMKCHRTSLRISDQDLHSARELYAPVYGPRVEVLPEASIEHADQYCYHYEVATRYIIEGDLVLDVGCGDGYGVEILSRWSRAVWGVDLEAPSHLIKKDIFSFDPPTKYDLITSFELFEHFVEPHGFLSKIRSLLRPRGYFIMSTPQNCLGHIPVNGQHVREYSLLELLYLVQTYFAIDMIISVKGGTVPGEDLVGTNSILVCRKR